MSNENKSDLWSPTDIDQHFDELCQRYGNNLQQYDANSEQWNVLSWMNPTLTPISEESVNIFEQTDNDDNDRLHQRTVSIFNNDSYSIVQLTVQRQVNHIGHYGFECEQSSNRTIRISSITDRYCCPNLDIDDEILRINDFTSLTTIEQYHQLVHRLWHEHCHSLYMIVRKPRSLSTVCCTYRSVRDVCQ
jgi:hypothetical protein